MYVTSAREERKIFITLFYFAAHDQFEQLIVVKRLQHFRACAPARFSLQPVVDYREEFIEFRRADLREGTNKFLCEEGDG